MEWSEEGSVVGGEVWMQAGQTAGTHEPQWGPGSMWGGSAVLNW